ncbi:MAG: hypothetical protein F6J93_29365 [Oscillatoria sp. SIO1A7]|nr:hypothetical protein [Oscillatoria sp. SIO1A7]
MAVGCGAAIGKKEASVKFSAFPYTLPPHPTTQLLPNAQCPIPNAQCPIP